MSTLTNHITADDNWLSRALVFRPAKSRRMRAVLLTATLLAAGVAACAPIDPSGPRDVGNMAFPAPLPQGNVGTTALSGRLPQDTGSMAYPAPSPLGNIATTTVR